MCMQEYDGRHCDVTILPWDGYETILSSTSKILRNFSREVGWLVAFFEIIPKSVK